MIDVRFSTRAMTLTSCSHSDPASPISCSGGLVYILDTLSLKLFHCTMSNCLEAGIPMGEIEGASNTQPPGTLVL